MNTQAVGCQTPISKTVDVIPNSWTAAAVTYGVWSIAPYSVSIPFILGAAGCCYGMAHQQEVSDAVNNMSSAVCAKAVDAFSYVGNKALEKGSEASVYVASKALEKSSEAVSFITSSLTGLFKQITYFEPTAYLRLSVTSGDSSENEKTVKLKQD